MGSPAAYPASIASPPLIRIFNSRVCVWADEQRMPSKDWDRTRKAGRLVGPLYLATSYVSSQPALALAAVRARVPAWKREIPYVKQASPLLTTPPVPSA